MKRKITLIIVSFVIENIVLAKWFIYCKELKDVLRITTPQITEYITRDIHNEQQVPLFIIRFFYNKVSETIFWGLKPYLRFWDVSYFVSLLSLIGCIGILFGIGYFLIQKKKPLSVSVLFIWLFLITLFEVFFHPNTFYTLRLILIAVPLELISLFGLWMALTKNKAVLPIIIIGIALSILLLSFYPTDFLNYCIGR